MAQSRHMDPPDGGLSKVSHLLFAGSNPPLGSSGRGHFKSSWAEFKEDGIPLLEIYILHHQATTYGKKKPCCPGEALRGQRLGSASRCWPHRARRRHLEAGGARVWTFRENLNVILDNPSRRLVNRFQDSSSVY